MYPAVNTDSQKVLIAQIYKPLSPSLPLSLSLSLSLSLTHTHTHTHARFKSHSYFD